MKDWKYKQQLYHLTNFSDDHIEEKSYIIQNDDLVKDIIEYFSIQSDVLIYPAKSYAVAIVYAKLLEKYFDEDFYEVLNDPELLYGNDQFFIKYSDDIDVYDEVISKIDLTFKNSIPQVRSTISYFEKEFLINIYKKNS